MNIDRQEDKKDNMEEKLKKYANNKDSGEEEEYEDEIEEEIIVEKKQVVNGPVMAYSKPVATQASYSRPKLTVHETKVRELTIQIHTPHHFDDAAKIADVLMSQQAALVNYEKVEPFEQRRICDFLNGVCYIMDGEPRRISDLMVVYVPSGVEVTKAGSLPLYR